MREIERDIQNREFKKVYLIFGEEDFLVKKYTRLLRESIVDKENALMNMDIFEGGNTVVDNIISSGDTAPFFSDYRLVEVSNSGLLKEGRKADTQAMVEGIKNIPDGCVYLFCNEKVDKRNSLYKAIKKVGYCCEINYQEAKDTKKWLIEESKGRLDNNSADYFIKNIGNSMKHLSVELDKLLAYCGNKAVTTKDIDIACTKSVEVNIFNMVAAIGSKNAERALNIYNNMIFEGEEPIGILAMIARQFRLILQCKYLQTKKSYNNKQIAAELKQRDFVVNNCLSQGKNFKLGVLMKAIESCADCDSNIKAGRIAPKLGVELIILRYCK